MFLDIANVVRVREALWRHKSLGSASVMVGAGFSRNADPASNHVRPMPNWTQMAEALCEPLYPYDDARRTAALKEATGTSGFLRLAQEYHAAFGPSSLSDKIRSLVPDTDYRPGALHKRLLSLPWADVFSTNWDTLLERSCGDVFGRSYDIVKTASDIPFTMRPRIVKLHGTFPSHEPFVFTEEDYRTYPSLFSPFVNLVQQSMMETVFCLVGFSGDDPNFLHWAGWVRDNLGKSAPKIYLAGWLELSVHRRRMLETRDIMPIDLSTLPAGASWPVALRHKFATEWFIAALELGKPYSADTWPSPTPTLEPPPEYLGPLPAPQRREPRNERMIPDFTEAKEVRAEKLIRQTRDWAWDREIYPNWFVAPEEVRNRLWTWTQSWLSEFSTLDLLKPEEAVAALGELVWRLETSLLPLDPTAEAAAVDLMGRINISARTLGEDRVTDDWQWSSILGHAQRIALALARDARNANRQEKFERALGLLRPLGDHDVALRNAVTYEECLWDLAAGDLSRLASRLDGWTPDQVDTVWLTRKTGLIAELGETARACELLERTLVQIRRARRRDIDDLASLSLEGWALFLALPFSRNFGGDAPTISREVAEPFGRWRELSVVNCNAYADYHSLRRVLEASRPESKTVSTKTGFDLGHSRITHHLGSGSNEQILNAYRMIRLAEVTGIPPASNNLSLFSQGLRAAVKILADVEPWLASSTAIRLGASDDLFDDIFSRTRVAKAPANDIPALRDALLKRIAFGLEKAGNPRRRAIAAVNMVASALEALSRIAVRLSEEHLIRLFEEAVGYFNAWTARGSIRNWAKPLSNLLARILDSLPPEQIEPLLPKLFALPLPGEAGLRVDESDWLDPALLIPRWFRHGPRADGPHDVRWTPVVERLLASARSPTHAGRESALLRLYNLHRWKMLDRDETAAFASTFWSVGSRDEDGIPSGTGLQHWVLVRVPEEHPGQVMEILTRRIVTLAKDQPGPVGQRLAELGDIIDNLVSSNADFALNPDVTGNILKLMELWATDRPAEAKPFERLFSHAVDDENEAIRGLVLLLRHVRVDQALAEKLWSKAVFLEDRIEADVIAFTLYPTLSKLLPERRGSIHERVRRALLSDDTVRARLAVTSVYLWINTLSDHEDVPADLREFIREIGIGIAARRAAILRPALEFAQGIFDKGRIELRDFLGADCDHGLLALAEEASYERAGQRYEVPEVRAACVRLAIAMAADGRGDLPGVAAWLSAATEDPLPEVRNAQARAASRGPASGLET